MNPLQQAAENIEFSAGLLATVILGALALFGCALMLGLAWAADRSAPHPEPTPAEDLDLIEREVRRAVAGLAATGALADGTYLPVITRGCPVCVAPVELVRVDDLDQVTTTADLPSWWTA